MSLIEAQDRIAAADALQARIAELRDQVFTLSDQARDSLPHEYTALHVSLQTASNELGEAARALRDASPVHAAA